jgi:hypothetical protein
MPKIGPKEQALRELKAHHLTMIEDGLPAKFARTEVPPKKKPRRDVSAGVTLAPPIAVQKAIAADLADDEPQPPAEPAQEERTMPKTKAKKAAPKSKAPKKKALASTPRRALREKAQRAGTVKKRAGVPALEVAAFLCRDGGASMAELVERFGIEAHPMRAKVFVVRHTLGYDVAVKDGRYFGTAPR